MASRVAHHIDFPNYSADEPPRIPSLMLERVHYALSVDGQTVMREYNEWRMRQPRFSNARSLRGAPDRGRPRQATRLFAARATQLEVEAPRTITDEDIRASRVFRQ